MRWRRRRRVRPEAIVLQARQDLADARKAQSDPSIAVGHYLDAADAALRVQREGVSDEIRSIYNAAAQEVTVLLRSSADLWNRTETIPAHDGVYRLHFAAGSHENGTWDPGYFNFFRTPRQVHEKIAHQERRISDWGGVLVGVYKPSDPRKYFLPLVGLSVPVTAALDFKPSASTAGQKVRDATLALYDPTRRETADLRAPSGRWPRTSALRSPIIPIPSCWDLWRCSARENTRNGPGSTCLNPTIPTGFQ